MDGIAVSVIIPAYDSASTICRAIDSVFAQTFHNYEVIVIDDGSSDDLLSVLARYGERIRILKQANRGAGAARNFGVAVARGHLLAFLDADDFWHERKLEAQVNVFDLRPDTVLCWSDVKILSSAVASSYAGVPLATLPEPEFNADFTAVFVNPYLGTPGVMMPKAVFDRLGGFRDDVTCAEDIDLWLRAAYSGVVAKIHFPLFCVVMMSSSLTARCMDKVFSDNMKVIDDFCLTHPDFTRSHAALVRQVRAKIFEDWGSSALVSGESITATTVLTKSLTLKPRSRAMKLWVKAVSKRTYDFLSGGAAQLVLLTPFTELQCCCF